jgi:hypothetical protein
MFSRGLKLTTPLYLVSRTRMAELYLHSPICLHGVVLNELITGITSPFYLLYDILRESG